MDRMDYENFNKEDFIRGQKERDEILESISKEMKNVNFESYDIQNKILELFNWMNRFYDCSINMFRGLAEVYEFNPGFSRILADNYGNEMPKYLSKAIIHFCNNKEGKE